MDWSKIHPDFKFNNVAISKKDIVELSYSLIKEEEEFEREIGNFFQQWINVTDSIIVFTSGSTGAPKSINLKKECMINSAVATGTYFNLQPKNTSLLCMSANFIAGKMMLVRAMVLGLHITAVKASSNPLDGLSKDFDFCAMVPLQLQNSLDKLDAVKTIIIGGAPMSNSLKDKVQSLQTQVFETYGMTETITHVALKRINNGSQEYFKALSGVTLTKDERDCLVINAPKISNIPVVTNDIVGLHSESEFSWLGRCDSIINSGGIKIFPEQIEGKLASLIENRFFVAGIPDEVLGQKLTLLIEGEIDANEVLEKIKELALEKYQIPKTVYALISFVYTSNGKINRKATLESLNL